VLLFRLNKEKRLIDLFLQGATFGSDCKFGVAICADWIAHVVCCAARVG
jgi:hypothetical protein